MADPIRLIPATNDVAPELPHNVEAEAALLGALMIDNRLAEDVQLKLRAEHFFEPVHGRIYDAILKLVDRNRRALSQAELEKAIRKALQPIAGIELTVGFNRPIFVNILGPDPDVLLQLANDLKAKMAQVPGIIGIKDATANMERGTDLIKRAPRNFAQSITARPTGPAPLTSTVAPRSMFALSTACKPTASGSTIAPSRKETLSGSLCAPRPLIFTNSA